MNAPAQPYPGIRPFREDEEYLFFGRESQVDAMVDTLARGRFLAVIGSSGCGKSSLVNCGLRPALHRGLLTRAGSAWRMASCRPGGHPLRALAQALAAPGALHREMDAGPFTLAIAAVSNDTPHAEWPPPGETQPALPASLLLSLQWKDQPDPFETEVLIQTAHGIRSPVERPAAPAESDAPAADY